jgi:flagellar hook-basal body complex protein FliE
MVAPMLAAKAYAAALSHTSGVTTGSAVGGAAHGADGGFDAILKNAMTDAVQSSRQAETQMVNQVQGKADLVDVATAISSAQASLETVMAVRDQVISAYQEIMRMPI